MKSITNKLFIISAALLISACSSAPKDEHSKGYGEELKGQHLYAVLSKDWDDRYAFTRFTTDISSADKNMPWVDLTKGEPVFSTSAFDCESTLFFDWHSQKFCSDMEMRDKFFYDSTISTGDTLQNILLNPFIAVYTLGTAVTGFYTVEFDEDLYIQALKEAKANFNMHTFLADLSTFEQDLAKRQKNLDLYIESERVSLDKRLSVSFIDKSKLYGKSPKNIASVYLESQQSPLNSVLNTEFLDVKDLRFMLNEKEAKVRSDVVFKTRCNMDQFSYWNYSTSGCNSEADLLKISMEKVTISLNSKKAFYVPYFPTMSDKNVTVKAENGKLILVNKTDKYLNVDSISMYVGNHIETRNNLNIEIAPNAISSITSFSQFSDSERHRTLYNVNKTMLKKHLMKLGAAIKYRIADTNKEKTLYNVESIIPYRFY